VNNRYRRDLASARVRLARDPRTDAGLVVRYNSGEFHFPTDFIGNDSSDFDQHTSARGPSAALEVGRWVTPRLETRASLGFHREESRYDDGADSVGDSSAFCCFHSRDVVQRLIAGARANVRFSDATVVTAGVELERQRQSGTTLDTARRNTALFAQGLADLGSAVSLTVGGRLDDNQQFGAHVTGRAGVAWRVDARTRVRASAGTAFKEPSFFENFATGFTRGNPDLRPERSTSWEVGLERAVSRVSLRATYFDQRFRDFIQYSSVPLAPDSVNYTNIGAATARGVELSVGASVVRGVSLDAGYTYVRTRDGATGQRLQRRPSHAGTLRLGVVPGERGGVVLSAVFTGDRRDLDFASFPAAPVTLRPHTRVDASGTFRVAGDHGPLLGLVLTARIENLLDARYQEVKNFRTPRRTILVGGELSFGR
jgi:vitamin B12 transporter